MGDMADFLMDNECEFSEDIFQALENEPVIWVDHKGNEWRLSQMESTHLVNILRLVVNRWAETLGVRPVPIKNPQAIINTEYPADRLAQKAGVMAEALLDRFERGETLPGGYAVVWERVVSKIQECLRRSGQPLNQKLLGAEMKQLSAA